MNEYRFAGDLIHVFAFVLLLFKLGIYKSAAGISVKTQILLGFVFTTRYLDLVTVYVSAYNTELKILYIIFSYLTVLLIYTKYNKTYEAHLDTFRIEFLIIAAFLLAVWFNHDFTVLEVCWTFSQYLEAVAAWPQFFMIKKTRTVKTAVFVYLTALGLYRLLYIANWGYRYYTESRYDMLSMVPGSVQVVPFVIFWILCLTRVVVITGEKTSWFARNLTQSDKNGIFTIQVPGGFDTKDVKPLLLNEVKQIEEPEGETVPVDRPLRKLDMPAVHKI